MTSRPQWTFYDPRTGDDYRFVIAGKREVSSKDANTWVAEGPNIDWAPHVGLLQRLADALAGETYVSYLAWWPGAKARREAFRKTWPSAETVCDDILIASTLSSERFADRVLERCEELGGSANGLWSLGMVASVPAFARKLQDSCSQARSPSIAAAIGLGDVQWAVCLDDGLDVVFVRLSDATAPIVDELRESLIRD